METVCVNVAWGATVVHYPGGTRSGPGWKQLRGVPSGSIASKHGADTVVRSDTRQHGNMAQIARRLPANIPGEFFVDASCIDCNACRQIAPATFRAHGGQSIVYAQPPTASTTHRALMALVACPTASIGTASHLSARAAVQAFPESIVDTVYFCGFTAEASFGAWSYLIVRDEHAGGNVLVDSPRFTAPLVRRIERLGGVRLMVLSHRDDIADHAKFASHFECPRVMHDGDGATFSGVWRTNSSTRAPP